MVSAVSNKLCACPKCGCTHLYLKEVWTGHYITFEYENNQIVGKGNMEAGDPYKVEALCNDCDHKWRLKGVTQISDFVKVNNI